MNNFWTDKNKPFFALAPMEDVTDTVFREIVLSISAPENLNILYTEFTSTDGLCHPVGKEKVKHRLFVSESERKLIDQKGVKLVAQIWGMNPEKFYKATKIIAEEYDFDGIDINMGCPVKKIVKQGACSALIGQPELAKEIISATKEATELPVSVKTRIGLSKVLTESWISTLLEARPAALIVHGRIQKDQSEKPADWNEIRKAVEMRNRLAPEIPVIGNGDVFSMDSARYKLSEYGVDGVMIGRGIFMNPWFFSYRTNEPDTEEKLALLWKHTQVYHEIWGNKKSFNILKHFFKIYTNSFHGAQHLRVALMETNNMDEVAEVLKDFRSQDF